MRIYTYIAADFDHDEDAVKHLHQMKDSGKLHFLDAHELQQSSDSSLPCSVKKSLKSRMDNSCRYVLIVGGHTDTVTKGGCQLCGSYNSYNEHCARGHSVDYRSYIKFECDEAIKAGIEVIVLYKGTGVNRSLCPEAVRWVGTHQRMVYFGSDGLYHWDDEAITQAFSR